MQVDRGKIFSPYNSKYHILVFEKAYRFDWEDIKLYVNSLSVGHEMIEVLVLIRNF